MIGTALKEDIMLLNDILPSYDFTEVHSIRIKSTPESAFRALNEVSIAEISPIVRFLFFLRALPEQAVGRKGMPFNKKEPLLDGMFKKGFTVLDVQSPREVVFGMVVPGSIGRVWKKSSSLSPVFRNANEFLTFNNPEYLKVVANFYVEETCKRGNVIVSTESRTMGLSTRARDNFAPYWWVIRPFSGLIRRLMLQAVKRRAEQGG